jgi:hypothetical protein
MLIRKDDGPANASLDEQFHNVEQQITIGGGCICRHESESEQRIEDLTLQ